MGLFEGIEEASSNDKVPFFNTDEKGVYLARVVDARGGEGSQDGLEYFVVELEIEGASDGAKVPPGARRSWMAKQHVKYRTMHLGKIKSFGKAALGLDEDDVKAATVVAAIENGEFVGKQIGVQVDETETKSGQRIAVCSFQSV